MAFVQLEQQETKSQRQQQNETETQNEKKRERERERRRKIEKKKTKILYKCKLLQFEVWLSKLLGPGRGRRRGEGVTVGTGAELGVEPTAGKDNTKVHFNLCEEISTLLQQNMIEVSPSSSLSFWAAAATRAGVKLGSSRVCLSLCLAVWEFVCVCVCVVAQMKPTPTKRHKANA